VTEEVLVRGSDVPGLRRDSQVRPGARHFPAPAPLRHVLLQGRVNAQRLRDVSSDIISRYTLKPVFVIEIP